MAGKKGRSGRKSNYEEAIQGNLEKLSLAYLRDNFDTFPEATKIKISLTIASKMVTQKSEVNQKVEVHEAQQEMIRDEISRYLDNDASSN